MYIISPLSNCASPEKRDRFLEHIAKIAPVTYEKEPNCRAYAWFRSAEDDEVVPHHWLRGLEIYEDRKANEVTHRASEEYKAFREVVGREKLLERPSDLRPWEPSGPESSEARQYIVIDELTPERGRKSDVFEELCYLAEKAEEDEHVLSFWVLQRGGWDGDDDRNVYGGEMLVFARYANKEKRDEFEEANDVDDKWNEVYALCSEERRTTWVESGLGFIDR